MFSIDLTKFRSASSLIKFKLVCSKKISLSFSDIICCKFGIEFEVLFMNVVILTEDDPTGMDAPLKEYILQELLKIIKTAK